tara:strand:+ start:2510 stop:7786 length:5277 start_codon:yes stop_codon:yes gene_type:complete
MPEPGRRHARGDQNTDLQIQFAKGQYWKAAPNASALTVLGNAIPNNTGGCKMAKGYLRLLANSTFDNAFRVDQGRNVAIHKNNVNKMCAWDLGNEHIMITYPDSTRLAIFRKWGTISSNQTGGGVGTITAPSVTGVSYHMGGASVTSGYSNGTINEWGPDPLRFAKKNLCTEVGGWIINGRPSRDYGYGYVFKPRPAFTVGLSHVKGESEEYYDPGRILPMIEAGYFTDDTNPKISFHGVPVPMASGQHKEMPWGAPFGSGDFWISDAAGTSGHGTSINVNKLEFDTFTSASNYKFAVTDKMLMPTQRFIVAMENNLDITGPNAHIFTGSEQTNSVGTAKLFWHIKSQEGGVDQEYSTFHHFVDSGEPGNIDDTRTELGSGASTESGRVILWSRPHPFSVCFDDAGNAYMSYFVTNGGSTGKVVNKKYIKGADGTYTLARVAPQSLTTLTSADFMGVKNIYDSDNDTLWTATSYWNASTSSTVIKIDKFTGTWDGSTQPTQTAARIISTTEDHVMKCFSLDLIKMGKRNYIFVFADTMNTDSDGSGTDAQDFPHIFYMPVDVTASTSPFSYMSELSSTYGWDMPVKYGANSLMRMFNDNGTIKMGVLTIIEDSGDGNIEKAFAWIGEFSESGGDILQTQWDTTFFPTSGKGYIYKNSVAAKHTFDGKFTRTDASDPDGPNWGYHGDPQGRLHHKSSTLNRWYVRRDVGAISGGTGERDCSNHLGRFTFNYKTEEFDIFDPSMVHDSDEKNKSLNFSEQIGCRNGAVSGESNDAIPTRLGGFLKTTGLCLTDWTAGTSNSNNGATVFFPTTYNGNCILAYPAYKEDASTTIHGSSSSKRLSLVYMGTVYGSSKDGGHPYLKGTTQGEGNAEPGIGERPYPSNNMWTGANMNPLTPVTTFGEDYPKTGTGKKPMLFGADVNLIDKITTLSGDIASGRYRYKFAFAKSGAGKGYKNTGAEGNIFISNTLDSYVELDLTEAGSTKGVRFQFNKPFLEGRTLFDVHGTATNQGDTGGTDTHYLQMRGGIDAACTHRFGDRLIGLDVADGKDGFYTHFDQWSPDNIITNPYLKTSTTMKDSTKRAHWTDDGGSWSGAVNIGHAIDNYGNGNMGGNLSGNQGRHRIHMMSALGDGDEDEDMTGTIGQLIENGDVIGRGIVQGAPYSTIKGGGLIHYAPDMDKGKPYIRHILVYRTANLENAGTDREAYFKVGEIDLVDDVDWTDSSSPITFIDTTVDRDLSSTEAHTTHGMIPVDGDNITAMAASGNRLWVAYNDTNSSSPNKYNLPSTLIYSGAHWEYFDTKNQLIVDDNLTILSMKDFEGSLWIFSNKGTYIVYETQAALMSIRKKDNFIIHSHEDDSERFLRVGGTIYILGEDGLYLHDPNRNATVNFRKISDPVSDFFKEGSKVPMGLVYDEENDSVVCYTKKVLDSTKKVHHSTTSSKVIYTCNYHIPTRSWWSYMETGAGSEDWWGNYFDDVIQIAPSVTPDIAEVDGTWTAGDDTNLAYKNRRGFFVTGTLTASDIGLIKVDDEIIKYTSSDDGKFIALNRGQASTSDVEHTDGALITNLRNHRNDGFGPLLFGVSSGESGAYPTAGIVRLGHQYVNAKNDLYIQTNWIGNPGEERFWDKLEIEFEPPIWADASNPGNDIVIKIEWDIDTLNPWAKDSDDTRTNSSQGNATPRALSQEIDAGNSYANYKEITTAQYESIGNGIPMIDLIPVRLKGEMLRLRLRMSLTGDSNNKSSDCTDIVLRRVGFRTRYIGKDRYK